MRLTRRLRPWCFAAVFAALPAGAEPPRRLVVISWDGAADWVVDRLLAEGRLPHLAALAARGVAAEYSVTTFPSKTAAGHAALWTGQGPGANGVTSNEVPLLPAAEHTVLESVRGFSSEALTAEPFYVRAARAGRRVVVLSATQSYPQGPHVQRLAAAGVPAEAYRSVSGFEHSIASGEMVDARAFVPARRGWGPRGRGAREARIVVGDTTFFALAFDDPADPVVGLDSVLVRQGSRRQRRGEVVLKPREADGTVGGFSPPFRVRAGGLAGGTFFRLFELAPDGSRLALYRRATSGLRGAISAADLAAYERAYPGFHDDPFWLYEDGGFGTPLPFGGDGTAERRVLELVAFDLELATAGTRWALEHWRPDVLFHYTPMSDSAGHTWMAVLDPAAPGHDPAAAARLWPFYARVFELQDAWLGAIVAAVPEGTAVVLVSDHGMAGTRREVHINRILADAGLLAWTPDGQVDLARTRIVAAFPDFQLRLNGVERKGGIVRSEERESILQAAEQALRAVRDPETGEPVVATVFRPGERPDLLLAGPRVGDLAYDLVPGYYPQQGPSEVAVGPSKVPWGAGQHGFLPERRDMHAIFYASEPGLGPGRDLPPIRHVDVAGLLADWLGLE
ncbi:MAG: alkaline phosphatase family protein [Thermoanaerobaculia bacterium]|nr:alkaline phosphatase family protein [Thermoanaerobaculia bacterium]